MCPVLFLLIVASPGLAGLRLEARGHYPLVLWIWAAVPGRPRRTGCQRARKCARPSPVGGHRERDFLFRRGGRASPAPPPPPPRPPPPSPGGTALAPPLLSARHRASPRQSPSPRSDTAPPGCRPAQPRATPPPRRPAALDRKHSSAVRARAGDGPRLPSAGTGTVVFRLCAPRAPRRWLLRGGCCYAFAPPASCCCCPASCCPSPTPSTWTSKVPPSTPALREVTSDSPWTSSSPARPRKWPRLSP